METRNAPTPEGESPGEIAIEMEAHYIAIEKAAALTERLVEKLRPALSVEAFNAKTAEDSAPNGLCPLASEIRRDKLAVQVFSDKIAELLRYIQL